MRKAHNLVQNPRPINVSAWDTANRNTDIDLRMTGDGKTIYTRNKTGVSDAYVRTVVHNLEAGDYVYCAFIVVAQVPPAKTLRVITVTPDKEIAGCAYREGMNHVLFTLETAGSVELRMNTCPTADKALNFKHIGLYSKEDFDMMQRLDPPVLWFSGNEIERGGSLPSALHPHVDGHRCWVVCA